MTSQHKPRLLERLECMEGPEGCRGEVLNRWPGYGDRYYPRCELHGEARVERTTTTTQNARGEWVLAIPGPYFFQVIVPYTECSCGKRFLGGRRRGLRRYEEHYALHHILNPALGSTER